MKENTMTSTKIQSSKELSEDALDQVVGGTGTKSALSSDDLDAPPPPDEPQPAIGQSLPPSNLTSTEPSPTLTEEYSTTAIGQSLPPSDVGTPDPSPDI